ncbi:ABC transporter ATP-binding protein [Patescibacteria group bacterium]|nr:ABC transporter ATP-binding protein [Patescibacteria group bacterium]
MITSKRKSAPTPKKSTRNNKDAIVLRDVQKLYILHHEKPTLTETLLKKYSEKFYALKTVTLKIKKGEKIGITGRNGSGKTTLLKLIAGIATPTKGEIRRYGKIVSLIDLDAGFHADLTGIQNIMLNGMLLGMTKTELRSKLPSIIRHADIGKFIDTPMFGYSLGMKLRLGFAIAIHSEPDILIMDEGISVGDVFFKEKNIGALKKIFQTDKTLILVSHNITTINEICERMIILDKGLVKYDGKTLNDEEYKRKLTTFT